MNKNKAWLDYIGEDILHLDALSSLFGREGSATILGALYGLGIYLIYAGLKALWSYIQFSEPATILFDYLPDDGTVGEVLWFGRNLMSVYANILPILFLSVVIICLWCASSFKPMTISVGRFTLAITYLLLLGFYCFSPTFLMGYSLFGTIITVNRYVYFASIAILSFAFLLLWLRNMTLTNLLYAGGIAIFSLALVGAVDIITFYICFEALSLLTYGIVATNKTVGSAEGALKYFIYGIISSILLVFGLSLYYVTYQTVDLYEIYIADSVNVIGLAQINFALLAILLIVLAFAYKMSMFPFHFSLPDVYEGVQWETIAIINLGVKLTLSLVLFKIWGFIITQVELTTISSSFLLTLAIISLIIGCFGALIQTSVKRFFAYTSINQAGFIVLGLLVNDVIGLQASLVYLMTYMLTMFIFFSGITLANWDMDGILELKHLPIVSKVLVAMSLFSMAGIPPFFSFVSKYWIWLSLIHGIEKNVGEFYHLMLIVGFIVSIIVSLISAYYYLRLIKVYLFDNSINADGFNLRSFLSIAVLLSVLSLLFLIGGWFMIAEEIANVFWFWARDNYGSWVDYLYAGYYREWLRL
jgi:NADH-quinone oxidoreductase subunit N